MQKKISRFFSSIVDDYVIVGSGYTYDYANRLTKVEKNDTTIGEYEYDDDKRIQTTETNETTTYIYTGWSVLYEENSTGTACYVYGPTGLLAKRTTVNQESNTYFYHTDHLGSTRLVTDNNKNIVSAVTYHPFGEIDIKEGSEDFLFTGKEIDSTGLYYYGARYYDSELGRFITKDTWTGKIHRPQSLNRYTYCYNNPIKFTDPWGNSATVAVVGTAAVLGSIPVVGWIILGGAAVGIVVYAAYKWYKNYKKGEIEITDYKKREKAPKADFELGDGRKGVVRYYPDGTVEWIFIEDAEGGHWTYWKENGKWRKHYKDKNGKRSQYQDVTDQDEIDALNELEEELLEKENPSADEESGDSGESGSGGENGPLEPNQPF